MIQESDTVRDRRARHERLIEQLRAAERNDLAERLLEKWWREELISRRGVKAAR